MAGEKKHIKWIRGKDGRCDSVILNGYRFSIVDWIKGLWYINRTVIVNMERRKFKTYKELYVALTGHEPLREGEVEAKYSVRSVTNYVYGDEYHDQECRRFVDSEFRTFAIDMRTKEMWEYSQPVKVSPTFLSVAEAKTWADEELAAIAGVKELF